MFTLHFDAFLLMSVRNNSEPRYVPGALPVHFFGGVPEVIKGGCVTHQTTPSLDVTLLDQLSLFNHLYSFSFFCSE